MTFYIVCKAWVLSNATSEHTPSESIATIDDEEMQVQSQKEIFKDFI